ncbi:hypothetical protein E5672_15995 [Alteromonas portus]|uniref:Uncharacterized protein n=1 Tax=Alteromonas portus TaxID=2565549 RepID=A0A4U0Z8J4_9ALTE|nr:hypothetical protein [Alteromonas portus]TKB01999.1 hypothetical protein E5672_15995 [Alteromonas portus]
MAKHLKHKDVENILNLLISWQYELTWDLLVKECEQKLGLVTTRQALSRKTMIQNTFNETKERLKTKGEVTARPNSINIAHQRIERLAKENEVLKKQNQLLLEQFIVWQYNATAHGLTKQQLEKPIPKLKD